MKLITRVYLSYIAIWFVVLLFGCNIHNPEFTNEELKWLKPFNKTDTAIFKSDRNEFDTIIFYKKDLKSDSIRSIERGYYNTSYLTVAYKPTPGSYHQFALMGDGQRRYDQNVVNMYKSSSGNKITVDNNVTTLELTFLGTYFDGKELSNIQKIGSNQYYFDSKKATYKGMDMEKGKSINDFTFDVNIGIVKYTDVRNVHWVRN